MAGSGISKPEDFRRVLQSANIEQVNLPSGLSVLLCRPPVFAALAMGRMGTQLQARITDAKPEEVKKEDIEAFTLWLSETLTRLFVTPRFAGRPSADEIGLADILIDDLKFIFRWLRGEVFSAGSRSQVPGARENPDTRHPAPDTCTEDLGRFPGRQEAPSLPGGSGKAELLPTERVVGTHWYDRVPAGLHRG